MDVDLPQPNECDTKLNQLLDAALEKHKVESDTIAEYCEELKRDPSKRLRISSFNLREMTDTQRSENPFTTITILFKLAEDCAVWKACLSAPFVKHGHNPGFPRRLQCDFYSGKMENVLEIITPLIQRTDFTLFETSNVPPERIKLCSAIFNGTNVDAVVFTPRNNENHFEPYLHFVRVVRPTTVCYNRSGHADEVATFLLPLANLVEAIGIDEDLIGTDQKPLPLSVVKEMLSRKCKILDIQGIATVFSLNEAEDLIQFISHLDKRFGVQIPTDFEPMNLQIGEYKYSKGFAFNSAERRITRMRIEHLHIPSDMLPF